MDTMDTMDWLRTLTRDVADISALTLIVVMSPNGHPEIRSVEKLLDMIEEVRQVSGKPLVFEAGWARCAMHCFSP